MLAWSAISKEIRKKSVDDREYLVTHYVLPPDMSLKKTEVYCNDVEFTHEFVRGRESIIELPVDQMSIRRDKVRRERQSFYFAGVSHSHGNLEGLFSFEDLKLLFLSQKDMNFGLFVHLLTPTMDRLVFRTGKTPRYGKKLADDLMREMVDFQVDFLKERLSESREQIESVGMDHVDELTKSGLLQFLAEQHNLVLFEKKVSETIAKRVSKFTV
ncbi:hypothetical protein KBC75_05955 [Candidatus Shapirobacteria bacterium]|nr:hypothetical protein [Candidatus Shapirobacteria bacterium]